MHEVACFDGCDTIRSQNSMQKRILGPSTQSARELSLLKRFGLWPEKSFNIQAREKSLWKWMTDVPCNLIDISMAFTRHATDWSSSLHDTGFDPLCLWLLQATGFGGHCTRPQGFPLDRDGHCPSSSPWSKKLQPAQHAWQAAHTSRAPTASNSVKCSSLTNCPVFKASTY